MDEDKGPRIRKLYVEVFIAPMKFGCSHLIQFICFSFVNELPWYILSIGLFFVDN